MIKKLWLYILCLGVLSLLLLPQAHVFAQDSTPVTPRCSGPYCWLLP